MGNTKKQNNGSRMLLALYFKNKGNWDKMYEDILNHTSIPNSMLERAENEQENYVTMLDEDYPEAMKRIHKPPFVMSREEIANIKDYLCTVYVTSKYKIAVKARNNKEARTLAIKDVLIDGKGDLFLEPIIRVKLA